MAQPQNTIHFIMTGGTIDSFYDGAKDSVTPNVHSEIPRFVKEMKLHEQIVFTEACMKDSRNLTEKDMERVCTLVHQSRYRKIIITHGTYTMPDTAKYLKSRITKLSKVVVFTGSLIPLIGFSPSDAPFNLGYSIAKIHYLRPGIYVCMNGRIFSPEEVAKLLAQGRFILVFGERRAG